MTARMESQVLRADPPATAHGSARADRLRGSPAEGLEPAVVAGPVQPVGMRMYCPSVFVVAVSTALAQLDAAVARKVRREQEEVDRREVRAHTTSIASIRPRPGRIDPIPPSPSFVRIAAKMRACRTERA